MLEQLFREFEFNKAADNHITEVAGIKLPADYISFMMEHNGGEGSVGDNAYAILFKLEELKRINDDYKISEYIPGYVVLGTDGGGMLLGYSDKTKTYFAVDACAIDESEIFYEENTFDELFRKMDEELK